MFRQFNTYTVTQQQSSFFCFYSESDGDNATILTHAVLKTGIFMLFKFNIHIKYVYQCCYWGRGTVKNNHILYFMWKKYQHIKKINHNSM